MLDQCQGSIWLYVLYQLTFALVYVIFGSNCPPSGLNCLIKVLHSAYWIDWLNIWFNLGSTLSKILFSVAKPLIHHLHTFVLLYIQYIHVLFRVPMGLYLYIELTHTYMHAYTKWIDKKYKCKLVFTIIK